MAAKGRVTSKKTASRILKRNVVMKSISMKSVTMKSSVKAKVSMKAVPKKHVAEKATIAKEAGAKRKAVPQEVLKRPAGAKQEDEPVEDVAQDEPPKEQAVDPVGEARAAAGDVRKQQRMVDKLNAENEKFLQRIKDNKAVLRKAEKELEASKDLAKRKSRKLGEKLRKQIRTKMMGKANRAQAQGDRITNKLKAVRKRYNKLRAAANKVTGKAGDAEKIYIRAQAKYDEAKKLCARLKKEGDDVPEEGEKDLSAPGAWKPPGLQAAKARDAAKQFMIKAKATFEKKQGPPSSREERLQALKDQINDLKQKQDEAEEAAKTGSKKK